MDVSQLSYPIGLGAMSHAGDMGQANCISSFGHTICSALRAVALAHEADNLFDLSKQLNSPEDVSRKSDAPEKVDELDVCVLFKESNAPYTSEQLLSWDLLSEPLYSYSNTVLDHLDQPSPEHDRQPRETSNVPSALEGNTTQRAKAYCDGNCNGDLIGPHTCKRNRQALRITCLSKSCTAGFTTKHGFNRHCKSVHKLGTFTDCEVPGCSRVGPSGFTRRDNMVQHLREVHGVNAPMQKYRMRGRVQGYGH